MKNFKVDFINSSYRRYYQSHKDEIDYSLQKCLSTGQLTLRKDLWDLEKRFAKYIGTKYAAGVNSGTDALFLSLLALGVGPGDEVITVSNTFIATIQAIIHTGATPILIDVGEDEQMNVDLLEGAITSKTKAIVPVHYTGSMCDMDRITDIASEKGIFVVEDACQAVGATQGGIKAGAFGHLGCFSFNTAKLMGGLCDGGMVTTNSRELYEKICLLRNHWNVHQLSVDRNDYPQPEEMQWAWKSRLSNLNAAFLNIKFKYLKQLLNARKDIANIYLYRLADTPLILPHDSPGRVWQEFHIRVKNRAEFAAYLTKKCVETLTRDTIPNHRMKGLNLSHFDLLVTDTMAAEITRLPLYPEMHISEVDYVIKTIHGFFK